MEQKERKLVRNNMKLVTKKENQGHNGEREVVTYITYDPNTGKEYDVADIYDLESEDVFSTK